LNYHRLGEGIEHEVQLAAERIGFASSHREWSSLRSVGKEGIGAIPRRAGTHRPLLDRGAESPTCFI
jgi:hypothetical protein